MYFLKTCLDGMHRRWLASALVVFGGVALVCSGAAIGLWAFWLSQENVNFTAQRNASVLIDTTDDSVVLSIAQQITKVSGVAAARAIAPEEFSAYLKDHFPVVGDLLTGLGNDVIPRFVEVNIPLSHNSSERAEVLADIQSLPQVLRVEDSAPRVEKALSSLHWLGISGFGLAIGLWGVLCIVCLGHYQGAFQGQISEMQLLRSFGATKFSLFLPWLLEGLLQATLTAILSLGVLAYVHQGLFSAYNDFFGTVGFEPLRFSLSYLPFVFFGALLLALGAHVLGGSVAFLRSKIA